MQIIWTDYFKYRATLRDVDLSKIEDLVKYASERYSDMRTGRRVAVGRYNNDLVLIPYEADNDSITPITVHTTTRQQINMRIKTGRYLYE